MATTAELLERQAALEEALASGVQRIRYGSTEIQYSTAMQMKSALAEVRRELRGAAPVTEIRFKTSKGLGR